MEATERKPQKMEEPAEPGFEDPPRPDQGTPPPEVEHVCPLICQVSPLNSTFPFFDQSTSRCVV